MLRFLSPRRAASVVWDFPQDEVRGICIPVRVHKRPNRGGQKHVGDSFLPLRSHHNGDFLPFLGCLWFDLGGRGWNQPVQDQAHQRQGAAAWKTWRQRLILCWSRFPPVWGLSLVVHGTVPWAPCCVPCPFWAVGSLQGQHHGGQSWRDVRTSLGWGGISPSFPYLESSFTILKWILRASLKR